MEKVDLEALDALHAAATPGEWAVLIEEHDTESDGTVIAGEILIPQINRMFHSSEWAESLDWQRDQANAEAIAALHNAYPAMAAELRALREERDRLWEDYRRLEQVRHDLMRRCERMKSLEGMPLDEIAARQLEREDTSRAEVESLKAKWKREECAHCDERPGGHLGTIWCAECFNWHYSEAAKERMQSELDAAMAEAARLREGE